MSIEDDMELLRRELVTSHQEVIRLTRDLLDRDLAVKGLAGELEMEKHGRRHWEQQAGELRQALAETSAELEAWKLLQKRQMNLVAGVIEELAQIR